MDTFYPRCATIEEANNPNSEGMVDLQRQVTRKSAHIIYKSIICLSVVVHHKQLVRNSCQNTLSISIIFKSVNRLQVLYTLGHLFLLFSSIFNTEKVQKFKF
jgi:uncharacterized membrane protein YcjF (UPF0283 family)